MPDQEIPQGHRGEGVFVFGGCDLRIRNLSITIDGDGTAQASPATTDVRTDTFRHWLRVGYEAVDHAQAARAVPPCTS